jgi:hypothetical protein
VLHQEQTDKKIGRDPRSFNVVLFGWKPPYLSALVAPFLLSFSLSPLGPLMGRGIEQQALGGLKILKKKRSIQRMEPYLMWKGIAYMIKILD